VPFFKVKITSFANSRRYFQKVGSKICFLALMFAAFNPVLLKNVECVNCHVKVSEKLPYDLLASSSNSFGVYGELYSYTKRFDLTLSGNRLHPALNNTGATPNIPTIGANVPNNTFVLLVFSIVLFPFFIYFYIDIICL